MRTTLGIQYRVMDYNDRCLDVSTAFPIGPPGPPGVVIVEEITESTATLSWSPATDNHSPISSYNLQARSPFSLGWQTVKTGKVLARCHTQNQHLEAPGALAVKLTQDRLSTAEMHFTILYHLDLHCGFFPCAL